MCGRYSQTQLIKSISSLYDLARSVELIPRYNIAPSQPAPVIIAEDGERVLDLYRWGLIPSWAKDPIIGNKMINARSETVLEKPSFKRLAKRNRCLVLSDGFYEWRREEGSKAKMPMRILMKSEELFAFAGLWDSWVDVEGKETRTFTVLTTSANVLMNKIHNRMPVILRDEFSDAWLDEKVGLQDMTGVFDPYPDHEMEYYPVSKAVNSPKNDGPECWERFFKLSGNR
ncbi:MAG: SOS response-associated peptidase [Nitrospiria bacterium]